MDLDDGRLDQATLDDLKSLGQPGRPNLFVQLVGIFVAEMPERLEALRRAIESRDAEFLKESAHRLKGSSLQMGARKLSAFCDRIEDLVRRDEFPDESLLQETEIEAAQSCTALQVEAKLTTL